MITRSTPRLAFVYHPRTPGVMSLAVEAKSVCDVLWIVDTSQPGVEPITRLLSRFGTCLDVAGMALNEAVSSITEYAPQGILSLADESLLWTSHVAEHIGLNFMSPESALRLTDKHVQRKALRDGGLAVPGNWIINSSDIESALKAIEREASFPAVLKPRIGAASRDTIPIPSFEELRSLWALHQALNMDAQEFVLEEFIPDSPKPLGGEGFAGYVSVESFVQDGGITHLAVNGRMPPAPPFRETGFFIPSALDAVLERDVLEVASKAIAAMEMRVGCLHTEIKLTPTGPVVIEVNGRIGGGVPELLLAATGVKFLSIAMRLALGERVTPEGMPHCERVAYLLYVQAPADIHVITSVDGLNDLREVDGVDEIVLNRGPGQSVDWREGNHGYTYSVFGTVADHDELRHLYDLVGSLVTIRGE